MLKIYDQEHIQLGMLTKYADPKVESILSSADRILSFTVKDPDEIPLKNEYYVRTRTDEYVIKKISHKSWSDMAVTCLLNLEELQGNPFLAFSVRDKCLNEAVELALQGTGWSIGECDVDKVRSAGMMNCNSLQVIENLCTAWMCDHRFDTIHKKVNLYQKMGEKKGAYFMGGLNLKRITKESDSYDYYTRIIPIGAEGLTIESVNDGKNYLENYKYSGKKLTYIWKDESYTDPQTLMEDGEAKLQEMSEPAETYSCDIVDLAKQRKDYGLLSYGLGDEVKLIDRETRTMASRRITKTVEYLHNPDKNSCEFSSVTMTFTEMQEKLKKSSDIVNFVITDDGRYSGTINVSDIINLEGGIARSETLQSFNADLAALQMSVKKMENEIGNVGNLNESYARLDGSNIPRGWVENDMLSDGAVTAEKVDIQNLVQKLFADVITGPKFADAVLTGADIEAESLKVNGKDVGQILENLSGQIDADERITALEEKVEAVIAALRNVITDAPEE
ncbi:MAG: phage tail spike protein [Lachnospiraceae bacterium]|nr:phage tail spike protein [Lachnospiraceae bacterium]